MTLSLLLWWRCWRWRWSPSPQVGSSIQPSRDSRPLLSCDEAFGDLPPPPTPPCSPCRLCLPLPSSVRRNSSSRLSCSHILWSSSRPSVDLFIVSYPRAGAGARAGARVRRVVGGSQPAARISAIKSNLGHSRQRLFLSVEGRCRSLLVPTSTTCGDVACSRYAETKVMCTGP